jgi:CDP-diacylglycerol---glycerol-3-phosphate 3-phosphatidyltransferase
MSARQSWTTYPRLVLGRRGVVPITVRDLAERSLRPLVQVLGACGISANMVTACSLVLGAVAGVLVACGMFAAGALAIGLASLGDAIDGMVARASGTASDAGAIFDASTDRYEEVFFLSGLAFQFRLSILGLGLVLLAMLASFMVSYGSAKAEALRVPVPGGAMRRTQRAVCLTLGTALVPVALELVRRGVLPATLGFAPAIAALVIVGVVGNVSAIRRLRAIAGAAAHHVHPLQCTHSK